MNMSGKDWFHQISNLVILVVSALVAFDWTTFFSASTAGKIVGGLGFIKLIVGAVAQPPKTDGV